MKSYKTVELEIRKWMLRTILLTGIITWTYYGKADSVSANTSSLTYSGITGKVVRENMLPVEYATIALYQLPDSSLAGGCMANWEGVYAIQKVEPGTYYIQVSFIGFEDGFSENFIIKKNRDKGMLNIPDIILKESAEQLDEVEVVVERQEQLEFHADKKVFDVEKNLVAAGGTGLDVLRNVPSVQVDENNTILLRGEGNVNVLIDGRPTSIPASELLQQYPASAIEKVEIITNPSARFDAEGISGILNIKLKKNKERGWNGNVNQSFGYGRTPKANTGFGLNYRDSKWNLSSNVGLNYRGFIYGGASDRSFPLNDSTVSGLHTFDEAVTASKSYNVRLSADYFINKSNTLYTTITNWGNDHEGLRTLEYENYLNDVVASYSTRTGDHKVPHAMTEINSGWQHDFNPEGNHTLDLDIKYSQNLKIIDELNSQYFYDASGNEMADPYYQKTYNENRSNLLLSKLDYVRPLKNGMVLESGSHFTGRSIGNDMFSESRTGSESYEADVSLINEFNYVQNVWAGYSSLGKETPKWSWKAGVRLEQTFTEAHLVTTDDRFKNDYLSVFPNISLLKKDTNFNQFRISYNKRINRPQSQILNPFTTYSDPYSLHRGNPFLLPEIIHIGEAGYNKVWKKASLNTSLYYRNIRNMLRHYLIVEGPVTTITYDNFARGQTFGLELMSTINMTKQWMATGTMNVWQAFISDTALGNNLNLNNAGFDGRLMVSGRLKKGWSVQLTQTYQSGLNVVQGNISPRLGTDIGLRKMIWKGKGSIGLRSSDIFQMRFFTFESLDLNGYNRISSRRWESRVTMLTFNWNFGKRIDGKKRRIKREQQNQQTAPDM